MSNAADPGFIREQYRFASHIRDPHNHPAPDGIEDRRMGIYRDLFYNNVEGFLSNSFPVLRALMSDADWHALARDFFARHRSHSPLFLEIPREFLNYLEQERGEREDDPPFLYELAHYEWVELALSVAESEDEPDADADGDLLEGVPVLSSVAWPLAYRYPVHTIRPDNRPDAPGEHTSYLLVYRDADDEVVFIELNPVSARLFSLLQEHPQQNGRTLLQQIAGELQHPDPQLVIDGGAGILEEWRARGVVLGSRR